MDISMLRKLAPRVALLLVLLAALLPQPALAVDYVIDSTGGDCGSLGGIWETTTSPPLCTVDQWTLAAGDTLTVEAGSALHVRSVGNLTAGKINNAGVIYVGEVSDEIVSHSPNSGVITNTGVIVNTGRIRLGKGVASVVGGDLGKGTVINSGAIENGGSIEIGGGSVITSTGTITNLASGTIQNRSDRIIPYWCCMDGLLESSGTLHNAGTIYVEGSASNLGSLTNDPTGVITLQRFSYFEPLGRGGGVSAAALENIGSIHNAGTLDNRGGDVQNRGAFLNTGTFDNSVAFLIWSPIFWANPQVYRLGQVQNYSSVVNNGVITDCGDIWAGNAPQGNPVVRQSCIAYMPVVGNAAE